MIVLRADADLNDELGKLLAHHTVENPIMISRRTLTTALERLLANELRFSDLTDWASLFEASDKVQYESGFEQLVADVVFALASPEINGPLNHSWCIGTLQRIVC